jgi:hypothetical protein
MTSRFPELLGPLAALVFVGGWVLAVAAFFIIGTETCADVKVPLAGSLEVCQDTTASTVLVVAVIGFLATIGAVVLYGMRLLLLAVIEQNNRS